MWSTVSGLLWHLLHSLCRVKHLCFTTGRDAARLNAGVHFAFIHLHACMCACICICGGIGRDSGRAREGRVTVCGYGGHEREGGRGLMLMSLL